jgi:hypothetical protein
MTISSLSIVDIRISFRLLCAAGCAQFYNSNSGNISSFNLLDKASTFILCLYVHLNCPCIVFFVQEFSCEIRRLDLGPFLSLSSVVKSLTMSADSYSDPLIGERKSKFTKRQEIAKFHVLESWMFSLENWRLLLDLRSSSRRPKDIHVDQKIELFSSLIFTF